MSDQRTIFAAVLRYMDAQATLARQRKEQAMSLKDYPSNLQVGDVLESKTGREYVVTAVNKGEGTVSYAYVPYDSTNQRVVIDTRHIVQLHWVKVVRNAKGRRVWPTRDPQVDDKVVHDGKEWKVTFVSGLSKTVRLERTIQKNHVPIEDVEVL